MIVIEGAMGQEYAMGSRVCCCCPARVIFSAFTIRQRLEQRLRGWESRVPAFTNENDSMKSMKDRWGASYAATQGNFNRIECTLDRTLFVKGESVKVNFATFKTREQRSMLLRIRIKRYKSRSNLITRRLYFTRAINNLCETFMGQCWKLLLLTRVKNCHAPSKTGE